MRILWVLLLSASLYTAKSQDIIRFMGIVVDSTGSPVELANVVATDPESNTITSFGVTDYQGRFVLKLEIGKQYTLKVSFMGFETFDETIVARENLSDPYRVNMQHSVTQLATLEIVDEFPVVITGDTITYRADAFTKGTERKLEDVLLALPGFEVNDDGQVKVQGKEVEKILVEGKEFFEGDTKIAAQNIPASAVEKVQVLRNLNEIAPMSSLNRNEDRLALNIKLAEGKENMLFGDVEAGPGPDRRYLAHANLFFYNPKATVNFIGDANNIGKQAFTAMDYYRFTGGMQGLGQRSGSFFNVSEDNLGVMGMTNNMARSIDTKLGALNFDYVPAKKFRFSGFLIASAIDNQISSRSNRTYINSEQDNREQLETRDLAENLSGLGKFDLTYTPHDNVHFGYKAFVKTTGIKSERERLSDNLGFFNTIETDSEQEPVTLTQQLELFIAPGERNVFSLEGNYSYQLQNPFIEFFSTNRLFEINLPLVPDSGYLFFQDKEITTGRLDAVANWYHILNKTNHVNVSFGSNTSWQKMTSAIRQQSNISLDSEDYRNDIDYSFSDIYAGFNYKTKWGDVTLNPGINLHKYTLRDRQLSTEEVIYKTLLLPDFSAKYEIRSSQTIWFQYALQAMFFDIRNIASGIVIENYNNLFRGDRSLTNSTFHSFGLNYYNFSMFNHFNIYGGLNYQKKYDDISNEIDYQNLERTVTPVNISDPNDFFTVYGNVTKTFLKFKISGRTNLSYYSTGNLINGLPNRNNSLVQKYAGQAETTLFKVFTMEVGYEKIYNQYESSTTATTYINDKPFGKAELNLFKLFTLSADYQHNHYRSEDGLLNSKYEFLNGAIYFQKEKSPWQIKISGLNLLNTSAIRRDSFSESLINSYAYYVQPRYFLFSIKYDI